MRHVLVEGRGISRQLLQFPAGLHGEHAPRG
jgi:hypothetical protein